MASIFISHSSKDDEAAASLRRQIEAKGFHAVFLDFDPENGIPAGSNWEEELYAELRKADAVVFLISQASAASRWCFAEIALARSVRKPVLPLAIEKDATHPLVEDRQVIALWKAPADGYARLWRGLERAGLDPRDAFAWDPERAPYPGLQSFGLADAAVFFGRSDEIDHALSLLQPTLTRGAGLVGVVGASGSGKSSLVRAGILPRLERQPERWIVLEPMFPGARPVAALARTIAGRSREEKPLGWRDVNQQLLADDCALADFGHDLRLQAGEEAARPVLVIDQLEELVTRSAGDERDRFIDLLRTTLADDDSPWTFIATLRAEFLTASAGARSLANLLRVSMLLGPMEKSRLHEVIVRPAQRAGMSFEDGLVGRMVEETIDGDLLPLLAFTLRRLYERAVELDRIEIGHADYDALGGVKGSLELQAQKVFDELGRNHESGAILETLTRLATVDRDDRVGRRRVAHEHLEQSEREILQAFTAARLVRADVEDDAPVFEVAHEALLEHWRPLRDTIDAMREQLRTINMLTTAAEDWARSDREASYLVHRAGRLDEAASAAEAGMILGPVARAYLDACLAQRDRELSERERHQRELSRTTAARAWESARTARADQPLVSLHLTAQAAEMMPDPQVRENIVVDASQLLHGPRLVAFLDGVFDDAEFDPGGRELITFADNEVRFWSAADGKSLERRIAHAAKIKSAVFNEDGSRLLVRGGHTARLWDPREGLPIGGELALGEQLDDARFDPTGKRALTLHFDTVCLWDAHTGTRLPSTLKTKGKCQDAQFSLDGRFVLMTGLGAVRLFNVDTGERFAPDLEAAGYFEGARLSGDGKTILTWSHDNPHSDSMPTGTIRLWDATTGRNLATIDNGIVRSQGATFCSDDGYIAVWGSGKARIFEVASGKQQGQDVDHHVPQWGGVFEVLAAAGEPQVLSVGAGVARLWYPALDPTPGTDVHHARCTAATFDPARRRFATWGTRLDTVRLWDMDLREALGPEMIHEADVSDARFGPRWDRMLTRTKDGAVRLWTSLTRASFVHTYPLDSVGHSYYAAFNPDGSRVLVANGWSAKQWDVDLGVQIGADLAYEGIAGAGIRGACYNEAGDRIATWGDVIHVWDAASGERLAELEHAGFLTGAGWLADRLVSWGGKSIRLWDVTSRELAGAPLECEAEVASGVLLPGRSCLLAWSEDALHLWDLDKQALIWSSQGHAGNVFGTASNRGATRILSWRRFGEARLWDAQTGAGIGPVLDHRGYARGPIFAPEGDVFLTWNERSAQLHDVVDAEPIGEPFVSEEDISGACFGARGTKILSWGGTRARLWDVATRQQLGASFKHEHQVDGAAFGRGDNVALIWGKDQCARLYDVTTGAPVGRVMKHEHFLDAASLSPDGRFVLVKESAGLPRSWRIADVLSWDRLAALTAVATGSRLERSDGTVVALSRKEWSMLRDAM